MNTDIDLVARHLAAVWESNWTELTRTVTRDAELQMSRGDWTCDEWDISGFYRYISQAWDFFPGEVQLSDKGDRIVHAKMRLTNGGSWSKEVEGEYRVNGDRIDRIQFVDSCPNPVAGATRPSP